jgi:zinc transporter ZupT
MEEKKMDELEKRREDLEFKIYCEKRAKKILLICTAICAGLGLIGGVVAGIVGKSIYDFALAVVAWGIWAGPGLGGAISIIPLLHSVQKEAEKRGEDESQNTFIFNVILFVLFFLAGPVGLLIRILRMNFKIKKFERQLKALR